MAQFRQLTPDEVEAAEPRGTRGTVGQRKAGGDLSNSPPTVCPRRFGWKCPSMKVRSGTRSKTVSESRPRHRRSARLQAHPWRLSPFEYQPCVGDYPT